MSPTRHEDVRAVAVVVPARDEAEVLPGCLQALAVAVEQLRETHPEVEAHILVVLDSCRDDSGEVARLAGAETLPVCAGSVGAARAAGTQRILATTGVDPAQLWLASTDADTRVPDNWLTVQVAAAARGVDAVVGTVQPDALLEGPAREQWLARHDLAEGHRHVHGANLGVRASAYLQVGGYDALPTHEDVELVRRLSATPGVEVWSTDAHRVITSSRLEARAPGGFAAYLRALVADVPAPSSVAVSAP